MKAFLLVYSITLVGFCEIGQERRVTTNPAPDSEPCWSPDGNQIAFMSYHDQFPFIYIINKDGTGERPLNPTIYYPACYSPAWSPDGHLIATATDYNSSCQSEIICTCTIYGKNLIQLTQPSPPMMLWSDYNPTWSPDQTKVAYCTDKYDYIDQIYCVSSQGGVSTRLTQSNGYYTNPDWSPDGTRIAFSALDPGLDCCRIAIMPASGGVHQLITPPIFNAYNPSWSPNSQYIAFEGKTNDHSDIYIIPAWGGQIMQFTNNGYDNYNPSWSPSGLEIAYSSVRNDNEDIYIAPLFAFTVRPKSLGKIKALFK